jgi:hypothetical protein
MTMVSNATILNTITIVIDESRGINCNLELSVAIVAEWYHNLEHHSIDIIYDCNILIV